MKENLSTSLPFWGTDLGLTLSVTARSFQLAVQELARKVISLAEKVVIFSDSERLSTAREMERITSRAMLQNYRVLVTVNRRATAS